jgi:hypothetical protein
MNDPNQTVGEPGRQTTPADSAAPTHIGRYRIDKVPGPCPSLLFQPTVVRSPRNAQRHQRSLGRPAAAPTGLLDLLKDPLLQLCRQLAMAL